MWFLLVLSAILVAASTAAPASNSSGNERDVVLRFGSFSPKLDHFRPQDSRYATFFYHANLDHHIEHGPIFVFVNDIAQSTTQWIEQGLMVDIARQVGAALVTADHRYFGENVPTEGSTLEELQFLTVDQAVADIAVLVSTVREHLASPNSRVILFGLGYGATLASMARKKYPHLIYGVWASSGHFRAEVNDESYFDNLSGNLWNHGGLNCHHRVQNAFNIIDYLIEDGEGEYLQEELNLCAPLNTENGQEDALLIERFVDLISAYVAQDDVNGITSFCDAMNFYEEDTLHSLLRWISYAYYNTECININYEDNVARLASTTWDNSSDVRGRPFEYLRCTQLGTFRIAADLDLIVVPPRINSEYHFQFCRDIFGEEYNPESLYAAVDGINNRFGGQDNQVFTHAIFTNAELDPWISHGISEYDQHESVAIFLQFSFSGADLRSISGLDTAELVAAKNTIVEYITRWVNAA